MEEHVDERSKEFWDCMMELADTVLAENPTTTSALVDIFSTVTQHQVKNILFKRMK